MAPCAVHCALNDRHSCECAAELVNLQLHVSARTTPSLVPEYLPSISAPNTRPPPRKESAATACLASDPQTALCPHSTRSFSSPRSESPVSAIRHAPPARQVRKNGSLDSAGHLSLPQGYCFLQTPSFLQSRVSCRCDVVLSAQSIEELID